MPHLHQKYKLSNDDILIKIKSPLLFAPQLQSQQQRVNNFENSILNKRIAEIREDKPKCKETPTFQGILTKKKLSARFLDFNFSNTTSLKGKIKRKYELKKYEGRMNLEEFTVSFSPEFTSTPIVRFPKTSTPKNPNRTSKSESNRDQIEYEQHRLFIKSLGRNFIKQKHCYNSTFKDELNFPFSFFKYTPVKKYDSEFKVNSRPNDGLTPKLPRTTRTSIFVSNTNSHYLKESQIVIEKRRNFILNMELDHLKFEESEDNLLEIVTSDYNLRVNKERRLRNNLDAPVCACCQPIKPKITRKFLNSTRRKINGQSKKRRN